MLRFTKSSGRSKSSHHTASTAPNCFPENVQHPDLPLSPSPTPATPSNTTGSLRRSKSVYERPPNNPSSRPVADRRSVAFISSSDRAPPDSSSINAAASPISPSAPSNVAEAGLSRSQTVIYKPSLTDSSVSSFSSRQNAQVNLPGAWTPDLEQPPRPQQRQEGYYYQDNVYKAGHGDSASMSYGGSAPKTSQDSGAQAALDRWSQRRLQRLNTEQGFRDQRQGIISSPPLNAASTSTPASSAGDQASNHNTHYVNSIADAQPQSMHHSSAQPHSAQHAGYQTRASQPNVGLAIQTPSLNSSSRQQQYPQLDSHSHVHQYSPGGPHPASQDSARPPLIQSRSFSQQQAASDDSSSMSNNGSIPAPKATRSGNSNRQSIHNGMASREGSHSGQAGQVPPFNPPVPLQVNQNQSQSKASAGQQPQQGSDVGRGTPQPLQVGDEMTQEEIDQLIKDHKELREKYTKVKKYYFEKEDQVKQLQNSLAHQRLSQSRTSLDDSEYTTRFSRLDGLVAQLAFSIRKSWKSIPQWLTNSINRDAIVTGKQEMTAAGRSFISCWLVEEVFDKFFHPDLDLSLSSQLKNIQKNIRRYAPVPQTAEEEEYLTSKTVNWRLATLEGLQEALRSPACPENRQKLTDDLKDSLVGALALHLQEPPPSDLEGGVHMIVELVVSIAIHLPLESRDVVIEYFMPGYNIVAEHMKVESGIPALTTSVADDAAERASMKSATSDVTDMTDGSNTDHPSKKRGMLSALTSSSKSKASGKHAAAGGSSSSLNRPESAHGAKEDAPPRVRMAVGIGVQVRGRSVLVKAPVFST